MIASSIYAKDNTGKYPEAIQRALEYIRRTDFQSLEPGDYPMEGESMFAKVFDAKTLPLDETRPEVHERYIDIQYWPEGEELVGFAPDPGNCPVDERIEEQDLIFYKSVENESFLHAVPGSYMIFFPNDVHRPTVQIDGPSTHRKVVIKVSVDLL